MFVEPMINERIQLSQAISTTYSAENIKRIMEIVVASPAENREEKAKELREIVEKYREEETMIYIEMLEKYKYDSKLFRQVKWSIEQGDNPKGLAKTLEMF